MNSPCAPGPTRFYRYSLLFGEYLPKFLNAKCLKLVSSPSPNTSSLTCFLCLDTLFLISEVRNNEGLFGTLNFHLQNQTVNGFAVHSFGVCLESISLLYSTVSIVMRANKTLLSNSHPDMMPCTPTSLDSYSQHMSKLVLSCFTNDPVLIAAVQVLSPRISSLHILTESSPSSKVLRGP